jgi:hypothetical protein
MSTRGSSLLLVLIAACATGTNASSRTDAAPDTSRPDAPVHDAPVHDAPIDAPPDAPSGACAMPFSGVLATWTLTGQPGSQASTAAASSAPGVTTTSLQRAATLNAATGSGSINSSNWPTAAQLDATKYYTFSFTPPSGCTASVSAIAIDLKASASGPASVAIATSADGFVQTTPASPNAASTPAVTVTGATGTLEIRVFGYAATSAAGTLRVQNTLQVTGSVQ